MSQTIQESYEEVAYPGFIYPQAHPDRLAVMAKFFGLNSPSIENCRVLELGCGDGTALISFAYSLPQSKFVGIDIAANHIEQGNKTIRAVGMNNIELKQFDVMNIDESFGEFDYIIAHGLISWVPDFVREKVFEICSKNLSSNGVVYLSYNTMPGCHLRKIAREMMLYHTRKVTNSQLKAKEGLSMIKFFSENVDEPEVYKMILQNEFDSLSDVNLANIVHDDFSEINHPFYFHEFMREADNQGLQFLAEADYIDMQDYYLKDPFRAMLYQLRNDVIEREQYLDFARGRRFRQTLLCRKDIQLNRTQTPQVVRKFYVASSAKAESENPDLSGDTAERFVGSKTEEITSNNPLVKSALYVLGKAFPESLGFDELLDSARVVLGKNENETKERDAIELSSLLLQIYRSALIEFHLFKPVFTLEPCEKPNANPIARHQSKIFNIVSSLRGDSCFLSEKTTVDVLQLLDGTRTPNEIQNELGINADEFGKAFELLKQNALIER